MVALFFYFLTPASFIANKRKIKSKNFSSSSSITQLQWLYPITWNLRDSPESNVLCLIISYLVPRNAIPCNSAETEEDSFVFFPSLLFLGSFWNQNNVKFIGFATNSYGESWDSSCQKSWIMNVYTGCKESQFYSLPFGQAVASMY